MVMCGFPQEIPCQEWLSKLNKFKSHQYGGRRCVSSQHRSSGALLHSVACAGLYLQECHIHFLLQEKLPVALRCKLKEKAVFQFVLLQAWLWKEEVSLCVCVCVCVWERERQRGGALWEPNRTWPLNTPPPKKVSSALDQMVQFYGPWTRFLVMLPCFLWGGIPCFLKGKKARSKTRAITCHNPPNVNRTNKPKRINGKPKNTNWTEANMASLTQWSNQKIQAPSQTNLASPYTKAMSLTRQHNYINTHTSMTSPRKASDSDRKEIGGISVLFSSVFSLYHTGLQEEPQKLQLSLITGVFVPSRFCNEETQYWYSMHELYFDASVGSACVNWDTPLFS